MKIQFETSCREDDYWDLKNRSLLDLVWNNYPLVQTLRNQASLKSTTETYRDGVYYLGVTFEVDELIVAGL